MVAGCLRVRSNVKCCYYSCSSYFRLKCLVISYHDRHCCHARTIRQVPTFLSIWKRCSYPLNIECHAGQAWLQLRVHLPHCHQHPQKQRKHGTSHLRCRARRAEARVAAEIAAAETYLKVVEDATIAQTRDCAS